MVNIVAPGVASARRSSSPTDEAGSIQRVREQRRGVRGGQDVDHVRRLAAKLSVMSLRNRMPSIEATNQS